MAVQHLQATNKKINLLGTRTAYKIAWQPWGWGALWLPPSYWPLNVPVWQNMVQKSSRGIFCKNPTEIISVVLKWGHFRPNLGQLTQEWGCAAKIKEFWHHFLYFPNSVPGAKKSQWTKKTYYSSLSYIRVAILCLAWTMMAPYSL